MSTPAGRRGRAACSALATGLTAAAAGALITVIALGGSSPDGGRNAAWPEGTSRIERLLERYDCWTGAGSAGVIPASAVVTLPGRRAQVVSFELGYAIAFGPDDQIGTGDERPGVVHGFCRKDPDVAPRESLRRRTALRRGGDAM